MGHLLRLRLQTTAILFDLFIEFRTTCDIDASVFLSEFTRLLPPTAPNAQLFSTAQALHDQGRFSEARQALEQLLAQDPRHADALHLLGMIAGQSNRPDVARELIERSLAIKPTAEAHNNLGNALRDLGEVDLAAAAYERAIALRPHYPGAYRNLANVFNDQGKPQEAALSLRKALSLEPQSAELHSALLYALHFHPEYDAKKLLEEHLAWARRHARPLAAQIQPHANDRRPDRRLRVGYVSPDFNSHPVGRLIGPLLAQHDRSKFEIIAYADVPAPDEVTAGLRKLVDRWYGVAGMSHADLAQKIRGDRVDILVDLAQHSGRNRMLVFARKPAPVQVAWLGYPGTTGLAAMDYRITDPYLDPPGEGDDCYSERSVRLPHCFWVYPAPADSPDPGPPPSEALGAITFGCMNRFAKVTRPTLELWRQILHATPGSRLLAYSRIGSHLQSVYQFFEAGGVSRDRIQFVPRQPVQLYFAQYRAIDIALDPIPHGGGATTCDALWMGVPVVTLAGKTAVGRGGVSILSNVNLPSLIAKSPEHYVAVAVELARDAARLKQLRGELRARLLASPLMDCQAFARDLEGAYRQMWEGWCGGAVPVG